MTLWKRFALNFKERILMWKTESLIWFLLAVGAAFAGYFTLQHIQFILYGLGALIFGFALAYAILKLIENPVKDELAIDKAKDFRRNFEAALALEKQKAKELWESLKNPNPPVS